MSYRQHYVAFAKLAKKAERYDEMVGYMDVVVDLSSDLTVEEHGLLDDAYHSAITGRVRRMHVILCQEQVDRYETLYCGKLEDEAAKLCGKILNLFDHKFLPLAVAAEDDTNKDFLSSRRRQFERLLWRCA